MILNRFFSSSPFIFDLFIEDKVYDFYLPNIKNTITGNQLNVSESSELLLNNGVSIVKDVPDYLKTRSNTSFTKRISNQYPGYLINLEDCRSANEYLNKQLSKRNVKNLFSKLKRLEEQHTITNKIYFGEIDINEFNRVFNTFRKLLQERFSKKRINNRYLSDWDQIKALSLKKILKREAALHVIFDDKKPIALTLNFHKSDIVFSHIQTYDMAYSKYNMGDIATYNNIKWCLNNNFSIYDLAIGESAYKLKWCNNKYAFMYHIYYDNRILSQVLAYIILAEYNLLKFLRDKKIIGGFINLDKLLFKLKFKNDN